MGFLGNIKVNGTEPVSSNTAVPKTATQTPSKTGGFMSNIAVGGADAKPLALKKEEYFATTTPAGTSFGPSPLKDTSGKPFLEYKEKGQTASTTDKTRVSTTFDPRVASPQSVKSFYNPRAVENRLELKKSMGASYNEDLDHVIALELSGSNNPDNLQLAPADKNRGQYMYTENDLAKKVARGEISHQDAQVEDARQKGRPLPKIFDIADQVSPEEKAKVEKKSSSFGDFVKKITKVWTEKAAPAIESVTARPDQSTPEQPYFEPKKAGEDNKSYSARLAKFDASPEKLAYDKQVKDLNSAGGIFKETMKNIPSKLVENPLATFGAGSVVSTARDNPEDVMNLDKLDGMDVAKATASGANEFMKGFVVNPVLTAAGAFIEPATGGKVSSQIHFKIPVLGDVSNMQYNASQEILAGKPLSQVITEAVPGSIFTTLFLAGMVSKFVSPREVVTKTETGNLNNAFKSNTAIGDPNIDVGYKSFQLYKTPTMVKPLSNDVLAHMESQGVDLGAKFNPELPTFFRMKGTGKGGNVTGEIVQIKPSYFDTFVSKIVTPKAQVNYFREAVAHSESMNIDKAIKAGDVPRDAVYAHDNVLTPEYAQGRVADVAQKLNMFKAGLGDQFKATVDTSNLTQEGIVAQGEAFLNTHIQSNPIPSPAISQEIMGMNLPKLPPNAVQSLYSQEANPTEVQKAIEKPVAPVPKRAEKVLTPQDAFKAPAEVEKEMNTPEETDDWETNYLPEYSKLNEESIRTTSEIATAKGENKDILKQKLAEITSKQAVLEQHFIDKWSPDNLARKLSTEKYQATKKAEVSNKETPETGVLESSLSGEKINQSWTKFADDTQSLNIPRDQMPQIDAEHRGALTQFLKGQDISHVSKEILPTELKPSQVEFSPQKVEKARNYEGGNRSILISSDNHVLDGHHQWIAALDNPTEPMPVIQFNKTAAEIIPVMKEFPSAGGEDLKPNVERALGVSGGDDLNTPVGVAKHLIRRYVERGDSLQSLKSGQQSYGAPDGMSMGIGGRLNEKSVGTDYIVVKRLDNGTEVGEKISLKKVFDEIKAEQSKAKPTKGKNRVGETVKFQGKEYKITEFVDVADGKFELTDSKGKSFWTNTQGLENGGKIDNSKEAVQERMAKKAESKPQKAVKKPVVGSDIQEPKETGTAETMQEKADKLPAYEKGSDNADIGVFKDGTPIKTGSMNSINPIEMPELVALAKELIGEVPKVKEKMGRKLGYFKGDGENKEIALSAGAFKDVSQVTKILAHEIGHLVDYLPHNTMKRGNLIGRLLSLRDFVASTFGTEINLFGDQRGPLELKKIRNDAVKLALKNNGYTYSDYITKPEVREQMKAPIKKIYDEVVQGTPAIRDAEIKAELSKVSEYWRPYDKANSGKSYITYRNSSKELYADAISMLFNSPGLLEEMAPKFYKEFFNNLDKKPQVRDAYFSLQADLNGDRALLLEKRREGVRGMFKEGDYKASELQKAREAEYKARQRDYVFRFKYEFVDKNQALIDRVNKLKAEGKIVPDDENPIYYLEERTYLGGKQKALMEKYFSPVYKSLNDNGVSWTDFGEYLFYKRIASGDRSEVANPRGITKDAAKELLDTMEAGFTSKQLEALTEGTDLFRQGTKLVTDEAYEEGMYTPEMYAQMQENPDYATFRVIDHLESAVTSKIYRSIGTLKDITNPADASIMKTLAVLRAVENQKVKRNTIDFLKENFPEDVKEAKSAWSGKGRTFLESQKEYEELTTLFSKVNKGKMEGYYVDPYIKTSLDNESVDAKNLLISSLKLFNGKLFRPLFIAFNPGFQAFNFLRDMQRFWKNTPDMTFPKMIKLYAESARAAKVRAFGASDNMSPAEREAFNTIQTMEEKQILSVTFNDLIAGESDEDQQIQAILHHSGIDSFAPDKKMPFFMRPIMRTLDFIKKTGDLIETLPKVAGYYHFTEGGKNDISKSDASFIRKNIGSPDFLAGGRLKPATNEIFLFSNSITQGIRSDIDVATNPRTRSGYWYKTAKVNLVPKILMFLATIGIFGDKLKKIMEGASEYDKTNYMIVPLGIDENGKSVYLRFPPDESGRLLSGLLWKFMNAPNNDQSFARDMIDIASYTGGQVPSLNPIAQDISATKQFLSGQNPYDFFRNRAVLSDDVYKAGGSEAAKQFAGWLFNQNGGSIFYKFYNEPSTPTPTSDTEKMFNIPLIGNVLGRFVRVTNQGINEQLNSDKQNATAQDAQRRLDEKALVNKYVKIQQKEGTDVPTLLSQMATEKFGHASPSSKEEADAYKRLKQNLIEGVKKGGGDPVVKSLIYATSNNEKIAIIKAQRARMSDTEYAIFKNNLLSEKIVTARTIYDAEK